MKVKCPLCHARVEFFDKTDRCDVCLTLACIDCMDYSANDVELCKNCSGRQLERRTVFNKDQGKLF